MRPIRLAVAGGALAALALAACEPLPPPELTPASIPGASTSAANPQPKPFRARRGWSVAVLPGGGAGERAQCVGTRAEGSGLRIAFFGGDPNSAFRLSGFAGGPPPGATERLTARFDNGDRRAFDARVLPGPVLEVVFPTLQYDNTLNPFGRSRSVSFEAQRLGAIGTIELDGSSWTINATDECRRMNVSP